METKITIELSKSEAIVVTNALNYLCNACTPEECSTLTGMERDAVNELLQRLLSVVDKHA